jgi:hypothetical protein
MTQQMKPITNPPGGRELLATAIECLIALLDLQEPDPELEANGDEEPTLGWTADGRIGDDRGDERELDTADDEPSLGWQNTGSQTRLHTSRNDCEEQCEDEGAQDDREPDVDVEPEGLPIPGGQGL